ncbi:signal peptidase II [Novosphingobium colocasiae]|uniref:signal peptidase II n=1 Tax=Novosphingobium colocasiae TaxID=1256513 RepID=UPI0035B414D5
MADAAASPWRARAMGLVLALVVYALDQGIKAWLLGPLRLRDVGVIDLLPIFDLRWTANQGVSLGLFTADSTEGRIALIALTGVIALFVLVWMLRERAAADIAALALVLGGALGNITDRYLLGHVTDYADLHFGEFRPFLIFNFADAAITVGVLIILARSLLSRDKPETTADTSSKEPI